MVPGGPPLRPRQRGIRRKKYSHINDNSRRCRKRCFNSESDALEEIEALKSIGVCRAYYCNQCRAWHMTSQKLARAPK